MQISAKARLISIIIAVVFMFGALAGTGAYLIVNHINGNAITSSNFTSIGNMISSTNNNRVDYNTYSALITKLGNDTTSTRKKSAINGGTPIVFQMGTVPGTSTPIYWEVVYQTGDTITVWMTQPYTEEYFNYYGTTESNGVFNGATQTNYNIENGYSRSTLRQATQRIYSDLNAAYPVFSKVVKSPSNAGVSSWQSSQGNAKYKSSYSSVTNGLDTQTSTTNPHGWRWSSCMSDMFWIPSHYEVCNTSTSGSGNTNGLWGLSTTDSAFTTTTLKGSVSVSDCWLRSGDSNNGSSAMQVYSSGSAYSDDVFSSNGVRPACHISLSSLNEATRPEITVQANDNSFGTVSGSGEYGYNSQVTITATPNIGYVFDHWELNGQTVAGAGASYTFTVTENQTYTAIFRLAQTTITSSSGSSDIIAQYSDSNNISQEYLLHFASGRYLHNLNINNFTLILEYTSLTLTNFDFCTAIEYVVNDNATQLYLKIIGLTGDLNIILSLADLPPDLQPATSGGGVDTVAVVSTYGGSAEIVGDSFADDSQITFVARNKINGYQFVGWFVGNSSTPISTAMSVRLNYSDIQGKVITARFEPIDSTLQNGQTDNNQTSDFA